MASGRQASTGLPGGAPMIPRSPLSTKALRAWHPPRPILHPPRSAISTKAEGIGQDRNFGVPWQKTYSCLSGRAYHWSICPQTRKRRAAFAQAVPMWTSITPQTSNNRIEEKIYHARK